MPDDQHHPAEHQRQAEGVVEDDLQQQRPGQAHQQDEHRGGDVRHLDPRPGAGELVVDELLVVQQLAVRLRLCAQGHDAVLPEK